MEKIKINSIEMKGPNKTICVVKYLDQYHEEDGRGEREATLNTKWQSQEVDYLQNDVGIGGEVSVLIEQKGQYTNITKVDFDSAVRSSNNPQEFTKNADYQEVHDGVRSLNGQEQLTVEAEQIFKQVKGAVANSDRDKSIIAQCLVKAVIGAMTAASVPISVKQAVNMYKEALELLG